MFINYVGEVFVFIYTMFYRDCCSLNIQLPSACTFRQAALSASPISLRGE
jgi:hypothetical protein